LTFSGQPIDRVKRIAEAIAKAEGFYAGDTLPFRNNNPGSLRIHGETSTISYFPTQDEGWQALYRQINLILDGRSNFYSPGMSVEQLAFVWTGNDRPDSWTTTVARELGVDRNTPIISV
jgi:hypothetical protein